MRRKRIFYSICAGVTAIALSAFLAYLLLGWDKEPQADYSWLVSGAEANKQSVESFVVVEPNGIYHIGDPVTLRFGVAYDRNIWEVPDEAFYNSFPFPDGFELRTRSTSATKTGKFTVIEARIIAQCLGCRDGTYRLDFGPKVSLRVKNKETGDVTAVHFDPLPKLLFAPLTDKDYEVDERALVVFPIREQRSWRVVLFVLASVTFTAALSMALVSVFPRSRAVPIGGDAGGRSRYISRVQELKIELSSHDARSIAYSLYAMLLVFRDEYGDSSGTLGSVLGELGDAYSKEGIDKDSVVNILEKVEVFLIWQGEA